MKKTVKERWIIAVGSWGIIDDLSTEKEAEETRRNKARWEQSPAVKIRYNDFIKLPEAKIEKLWAYKMIKSYLKDIQKKEE